MLRTYPSIPPYFTERFYYELVLNFVKDGLGIYRKKSSDFPGGPVVKTPCFHCRGHGFDPWLES